MPLSNDIICSKHTHTHKVIAQISPRHAMLVLIIHCSLQLTHLTWAERVRWRLTLLLTAVDTQAVWRESADSVRPCLFRSDSRHLMVKEMLSKLLKCLQKTMNYVSLVFFSHGRRQALTVLKKQRSRRGDGKRVELRRHISCYQRLKTNSAHHRHQFRWYEGKYVAKCKSLYIWCENKNLNWYV